MFLYIVKYQNSHEVVHGYDGLMVAIASNLSNLSSLISDYFYNRSNSLICETSTCNFNIIDSIPVVEEENPRVLMTLPYGCH